VKQRKVRPAREFFADFEAEHGHTSLISASRAQRDLAQSLQAIFVKNSTAAFNCCSGPGVLFHVIGPKQIRSFALRLNFRCESPFGQKYQGLDPKRGFFDSGQAAELW
jgi:hypothetical protein